MGLHSSAGRAALTQRPRVRISLKPEKPFCGLFRNCLNCDLLRWSHTHFRNIPSNSIKVALGIGNCALSSYCFGDHSSKAKHCIVVFVCPKTHCPIPNGHVLFKYYSFPHGLPGRVSDRKRCINKFLPVLLFNVRTARWV